MDATSRAFVEFQRRVAEEPVELESVADRGRLATPQRTFSPFDPEQMAGVGRLLLEFGEAMEEGGVEAVLAVAESQAQPSGLALVQHALDAFAVHAGKNYRDFERLPVAPIVFLDDAPPDEPVLESLVTDDLVGEDRLHWFREDLFLNEHHRHWHLVYPTVGAPRPGRLEMKDRQGELFVYMHQQMLARYDTERLAAGLPPVDPLSDVSTTLGDGYDPNARPPANIGYLSRGDGEFIAAFGANDLASRQQTFLDVVATGEIDGRAVPRTPDFLGSLLESNLSVFGPTLSTQAELDARLQFLGSRGFQLHNSGHGQIAAVPNAGNRVMNNPHTSLQDPVFWRWHRMIDDLAERFYETLPPHDFSNETDVLLRESPDGGDSPDVLLLSETRLRAAGIDLDTVAGRDAVAPFVEARFGLSQWDDPGPLADVDDELRTGSLEQAFVYDRTRFDATTGDNLGAVTLQFNREHLFSERFAVVVRAENTTAADLDATLRVFLCAEAFLDQDDANPEPAKRAREHRFWIEIERFPATLAPGRNVLVRLSDESSVVRKLQGRAPWPTSSFSAQDFDDQQSGTDAEEDYCDCGWPGNLALPRGTEAGMAFRLAAMVSTGSAATGAGECGSRAFCGAGFEGYPEAEALNLGFPFDRPAPGGTVAMIKEAPNMAIRSIRIRHDETLAAAFGL